MDPLVTVVNYGDYQCPDCDRTHREVQKTIEELRDRVRFYRHFPLIKVHPDALNAAVSAEAAAAQGNFWEMHRRLYLSPDKLSSKNLRHYAQEMAWICRSSIKIWLASDKYSEQVLKAYYNSIVQGISGAPTTFINGVHFGMSGAELLEQIRRIVDEHSAHVEPQSSAEYGS